MCSIIISFRLIFVFCLIHYNLICSCQFLLGVDRKIQFVINKIKCVTSPTFEWAWTDSYNFDWKSNSQDQRKALYIARKTRLKRYHGFPVNPFPSFHARIIRLVRSELPTSVHQDHVVWGRPIVDLRIGRGGRAAVCWWGLRGGRWIDGRRCGWWIRRGAVRGWYIVVHAGDWHNCRNGDWRHGRGVGGRREGVEVIGRVDFVAATGGGLVVEAMVFVADYCLPVFGTVSEKNV